MFCPKCGHSQTSGEIPLCATCGFTLERVKELLDGARVAAAGG